MPPELLYQLGLTLIDGIGDMNAKSLLAYCGSASEVFRQKKALLQKIPGIGPKCAAAIANGQHVLVQAEKEIRFMEQQKISPLFFTDPAYPQRLKACDDSPVLLYYKGSANLNAERIVGVVGTRRPSDYGKEKTAELVKDLAGSGAVILSGLAYGVDILAHKAALQNELSTIGVLAHGLDRVYPSAHERIARKMMDQGGLLTEFMSGTNPDAVNFPRRNRIVAGLCDALIVIESKRTGGSLITATIANSYNKDVFAYPGRAGDELSEGCNGLIKKNRAALIEDAADFMDAMQWLEQTKVLAKPNQIPLLLALTEDEKQIIHLFSEKKAIHLDEICRSIQLPVSKVSALLLQMEFSNLLKSRPGKLFERL